MTDKYVPGFKKCNHKHPEDNPAEFAQKGNFALGIIGSAIGIATSSPALLADAGHNFGDGFAHKAHIATSEAERHSKNNDAISASSRRAARLIGAIAAGTAIFSGYNLYQQFSSSEQPDLNRIAAAAELSSVGLNLYVRRKNKQIPPKLIGQHHSNEHNNMDLLTSSVAFAGIVANPLLPGIESVVGLGISAVTFRFATRINIR